MSILVDIEPNIVGDVVYGERGEFGPRKQPHLQLVYFYNGQVRIIGDDAERGFHGGEALFLIPGVTYRIHFDPNEQVCHGWVDLLSVHHPPPWSMQAGGVMRAFPFTDRMRTLASLAIECPRESPSNDGNLRRALGRAIVEEALLSAGLLESEDGHLPPAVLRAQCTMTQLFAKKLTLDLIARQSGVSKPHLIRLFREHLGVTPTRRLWQIRVEAGSRLLRETGLQVQEIADRCGFPSPYHFSRLIKQAHGVPPSQYRKRFWAIELNEQKNKEG
ncbi:AraC family transcriptional regulator [Cerasicoccus arenae]|nr:AraC family transcriptional regulator [Cerasicoccus arenae]